MARWIFEPGHSAAEFCVRHMMVTWVRGHFKDVHGTLDLDLDDPTKATVEVEIDAALIWSGEPGRDAHLRNADFLDVENHPKITFKGKTKEQIGENDYRVAGDLAIRGITRRCDLEVTYLGRWGTPFWVGNESKGPIPRVGFTARTRINRNDFDVSWNGEMERGGVVVGSDVFITIDVEALLDGDKLG
jgi:polyisoprenoid-binding protein YceI